MNGNAKHFYLAKRCFGQICRSKKLLRQETLASQARFATGEHFRPASMQSGHPGRQRLLLTLLRQGLAVRDLCTRTVL